MKTYVVKEIFGPTLQGEGSLTGHVTWFVRFAGCNMWDGRPETRAASQCPYCDTDFFGGTKMTVDEIESKLRSLGWTEDGLITLSGGEPLLQVDRAFMDGMLWSRLAIETNGTVAMSDTMFNLFECVVLSPKMRRSALKLHRAHDLKVLYPHPDPLISPKLFEDFPAENRYVQPVNFDDDLNQDNVAKAVEFCLKNPTWKLSLQLHKVLRIP